MTIIVSINGRQKGKIIFSPGGMPWVDPSLFGVVARFPSPVPLLPFVYPDVFQKTLMGAASGMKPINIPGIGVVTFQQLG